jgi:murein DD-endopeptidase MepM/ murein hydrolase activator NlpD
LRARLTLILTIAAVLAAGVPGVASAAGPSPHRGGTGWLSAATVNVEQRVELVARLRHARRARLAAVARALTTPPPEPPPSSVPGSYAWPGDGPITSYFGTRWGRPHTGVDIDAPTGSPVVGAQAGTVTLAGWKNGYGQTVIIDHGHGVQTLYAHLARLTVTNGQQVAKGQQVGTVGATGNVTAAHLHYEVHVGGVPRNPVAWLQGPR